MFEGDSILIVAHPDDEVLWFSSLLDRVEKVVICFSPEELIQGKLMEFFKDYPLKHVEFLRLERFGRYRKINFRFPFRTSCGLFIKSSPMAAMRYRKNCRILKQRLNGFISENSTVFTHNPWGEYGHEEHVQVSAVVKDLSAIKGANVWYDNYGSRKTYSLMGKTLFSCDYDAFRRPIDKKLVHQLKSFYLDKGCWTWDEHWEWFDTETFFSVKPNTHLPKYRHVIPVNLINVIY